jgi:hypothetical protein
MGFGAGLDRHRKPHPPLGFDPRTVQPAASRYTEYAVPAVCETHNVPNFRQRKFTEVTVRFKTLRVFRDSYMNSQAPTCFLFMVYNNNVTATEALNSQPINSSATVLKTATGPHPEPNKNSSRPPTPLLCCVF